jgi:eukaryotic-like serine/threonine-protein kinase
VLVPTFARGISGKSAAAVGSILSVAVELDPNLALTYEGVGAADHSLQNTELSEASFTRAYQLRDRLTEKDRLNTEILYYGVIGDWEKDSSSLLPFLQLFPRDLLITTSQMP